LSAVFLFVPNLFNKKAIMPPMTRIEIERIGLALNHAIAMTNEPKISVSTPAMTLFTPLSKGPMTGI